MAAARKRSAPAKKPPPRRPPRPRTPDLHAGFEPNTRVFTDWTPAKIRSAELAADSGNLRQAANLCDWILGDDRIGPLLHQRAQSLLGLDPQFEKSGDRRRSARAVRALEAEEDWWEAYPESELTLFLIWGILLGVAPGKHGWVTHEDHGNRVLPMPAFWHPQHLRHDSITRKWMIRVDSGTVGVSAEEELDPGDGTWLLHTPYGDHRPWALGLWRGLARLALLKAYAIGDWAQHSGKAAMLVATSGDKEVETSKAQRAQLAEDIFRCGKQQGVVVLPTTFDLKLVESVANTQQLYEAQINMANLAIAVAIRGGNLTTEVKGGSLAATEAQERLGDVAKRRFDAATLTATLHPQSLVWWAEFNFGDGKLAPWPLYPVKEKGDIVKISNAMDKAAGALAKFIAMGFEVDGDAFAEEFELGSFLKAGPDGIKAPPPPVPPEPPQGGQDGGGDGQDGSGASDNQDAAPPNEDAKPADQAA